MTHENFGLLSLHFCWNGNRQMLDASYGEKAASFRLSWGKQTVVDCWHSLVAQLNACVWYEPIVILHSFHILD